MFYGAPNLYERAEMINRAMLKENDGDYTKFVNTTKKPRDNAQKFRVFKNIARLYKNPFGYLYWKTANLHEKRRIRPAWVVLMLQLYLSFASCVMVKNQKESYIAHWNYRIG